MDASIWVFGEMETLLCAGDGVVTGEPWGESRSASEPSAFAPFIREANAAAVAAAASSIVPTCWFWWRVRVVRRVNVFWQLA